MVNGGGVRKENTSGGHEISMGEVDLLDSECLQFHQAGALRHFSG